MNSPRISDCAVGKVMNIRERRKRQENGNIGITSSFLRYLGTITRLDRSSDYLESIMELQKFDFGKNYSENALYRILLECRNIKLCMPVASYIKRFLHKLFRIS